MSLSPSYPPRVVSKSCLVGSSALITPSSGLLHASYSPHQLSDVEVAPAVSGQTVCRGDLVLELIASLPNLTCSRGGRYMRLAFVIDDLKSRGTHWPSHPPPSLRVRLLLVGNRREACRVYWCVSNACALCTGDALKACVLSTMPSEAS